MSAIAGLYLRSPTERARAVTVTVVEPGRARIGDSLAELNTVPNPNAFAAAERIGQSLGNALAHSHAKRPTGYAGTASAAERRAGDG